MRIVEISSIFNIAFCWKRCNKGIFYIEYEADNEIEAPVHIVPFGMFTFVGVQPSVPSPIAEGQRQEGQDLGKSAGRSLRGQDQSQGRTLLLLREAIQGRGP